MTSPVVLRGVKSGTGAGFVQYNASGNGSGINEPSSFIYVAPSTIALNDLNIPSRLFSGSSLPLIEIIDIRVQLFNLALVRAAYLQRAVPHVYAGFLQYLRPSSNNGYSVGGEVSINVASSGYSSFYVEKPLVAVPLASESDDLKASPVVLNGCSFELEPVDARIGIAEINTLPVPSHFPLYPNLQLKNQTSPAFGGMVQIPKIKIGGGNLTSHTLALGIYLFEGIRLLSVTQHVRLADGWITSGGYDTIPQAIACQRVSTTTDHNTLIPSTPNTCTAMTLVSPGNSLVRTWGTCGGTVIAT